MVDNLNIDKIMKSIKASPGRKNIITSLVAKMMVIHKCFQKNVNSKTKKYS